MAITNSQMAPDASVSATGGTAVTFVPDGQLIVNGIHVVASADTDIRTRRALTFKSNQATYDARKALWGRHERSVSYAVPQILADGSTTFNTGRIITRVHPEFPAVDEVKLRKVLAQLCFDTDFDSFWILGGLS